MSLSLVPRWQMGMLLVLSSRLLLPVGAFAMRYFDGGLSNSPMQRIQWSVTADATRLRMGGYYADPEVPLDQSNTHMVFGMRCLETQVLVKDTPIVWLQPTQAENDNQNHVQVEVDHGPTLIQYLLEQSPQQQSSIQGRSVLEVGASSMSLAAFFALEASTVVVCHPDEQRLRILDYTQQYINSGLLQSTSSLAAKGRFQIHVLKPDDPLPKTDVAVFTIADWKHLEEAVDNGSLVLVPASIIPDSQLQNYQYEQYDEVVQVIARK